MELYLIRHTTPKVSKNTIYGWSEVESLQEKFLQEATAIKAKLPANINQIFSSDSLRCKQLANHLFPEKEIIFSSQLRELHFGDWEMKTWNNVNQTHLQKWMDNFVSEVVPNGESYEQLYKRVVCWFKTISLENSTAIVCHAGVIRSLLCYFNQTSLQESFNTYKIPIACVYKANIGANCITEWL